MWYLNAIGTDDADKLARESACSAQLIFARLMFVAGELLKDLPAG